MGYTHYWERPAVLPRQQFLQAAQDCRQLCNALAVPLGGADGKGRPTFNARIICFNGHVDSGRLMSVPPQDGLICPRPYASDAAIIDSGEVVGGGWGGGPAANARVLGPDGDGSYEAFHVERIRTPRRALDRPAGEWFHNFCKTNYRLYDLCVQGCLIVLSHRLGRELFRVSSDGDSLHWNEARDACQHALGYGGDWGADKLLPVPPDATA